MTESENTWVAVSISFSDLDAEKASGAREIWPAITFSLSDQETNEELELRFDEPVSEQIGFTAEAVLDATDGARSWAVPVTWSYRRGGERLERKKSSLIYRPVETDEGTVAVDLVVVTSEAAPEGGKGRFDEDVELESELPIDPIPVSVEEQLSALVEVGRETLAFYRDHGTDPSIVRGSLPTLVDEVETALESARDESGPVFDTSFERFETMIDPNTSDEIGPIESDWLRAHALEADLIEALVRKRISNRPPERAGDLYYGLIARGDDAYAKRALSVLAQYPDEKALHALLMCLWYDDPDLAPRAIEILGTLPETKTKFTENDQGFGQQKALREIRNRIESSEHPEIRTAALETLSNLEPADPTLIDHARLVETIEEALEDPDAEVQQAAKTALEQLND